MKHWLLRQSMWRRGNFSLNHEGTKARRGTEKIGLFLLLKRKYEAEANAIEKYETPKAKEAEFTFQVRQIGD